MSAESLSLIAGTVLSLMFSYLPGARNWYDQFSPEVKRSIMLGLILLSGGIVYGLSCLGWGTEWGIAPICNETGLMGLIEQVVIAIIANQSIYAISPLRKDHQTPENQTPSKPKFV
jgi:hypothetical protein